MDFFYGLALVRPLAIETEILLAEKQEPVATETTKAGFPNDQ